MAELSDILDRMTAPGELVETLPDGAVRCFACAHRCLIHPGRRGICQVRFNQEGELRVPWGYVARAAGRPDRKKTLLPRPARQRRADLRHAGLRFPLRLLPELAHLAGPARPGLRRAASSTSSRSAPSRLVRYALQQRLLDDGLLLQRAADHLRMGGRDLQGRPSAAGCSAPSSPTATPPRRRCATCART